MSSFAVSVFIFRTWCPGPIKKYDTAIDYCNAELKHFQHLYPVLIKSINDSEYALRDSDNLKKLHEKFSWAKITRFIHGGVKPQREQDVRLLMDYYWHLLDVKTPFLRYLAALFYWVGFALISLPRVRTH